MPRSKRFSSLLEGLSMASRCALCSAESSPLEARVVAEEGERHLVHIHCSSCDHSLITLVSVSAKGISSVGMITDCNSADAARFWAASAVAEDDVLSTHLALRNEAEFAAVLRRGG